MKQNDTAIAALIAVSAASRPLSERLARLAREAQSAMEPFRAVAERMEREMAAIRLQHAPVQRRIEEMCARAQQVGGLR